MLWVSFFFTSLLSHLCTLGVIFLHFWESSSIFHVLLQLCEKWLSLWFPGVSSHRNSFVTPPNSQILMLSTHLCSYLYQGKVHYDVFQILYPTSNLFYLYGFFVLKVSVIRLVSIKNFWFIIVNLLFNKGEVVFYIELDWIGITFYN